MQACKCCLAATSLNQSLHLECTLSAKVHVLLLFVSLFFQLLWALRQLLRDLSVQLKHDK